MVSISNINQIFITVSIIAGAVGIVWSTIRTNTIKELKDAVYARDLRVKDLEKADEVNQEKIKHLQAQIDFLTDKSFNKELLIKMEQSLSSLNTAMTMFIPLMSKGGFVETVASHHQEIMAELDDIHAVVVKGKRKKDPMIVKPI